jgi:hypothetical protein
MVQRFSVHPPSLKLWRSRSYGAAGKVQRLWVLYKAARILLGGWKAIRLESLDALTI